MQRSYRKRRKRPNHTAPPSFVEDVAAHVKPEKHFKPFNPESKGLYTVLDCPACAGRGEAFLYNGGSYIHCNRKNKCGVLIPIINVLAGEEDVTTLRRGDAFKQVFAKAALSVGLDFNKLQGANFVELGAHAARTRALEWVSSAAQNTLISSEDATSARRYLEHRDVARDAWKDLGVGFLTSTLLAELESHTPGMAASLGLSSLAGYIVVPGHNVYGTLVALHGRFPSAEVPEGTQRIVSSRGSGIKDAPLFLNVVRRENIEHVVIVEGIFDALVARAHGDRRAVACMNQAVSAKQSFALKQAAVAQATLFLDHDDAGQEGIWESLRHLGDRGIRPFVVTANEGGPA